MWARRLAWTGRLASVVIITEATSKLRFESGRAHILYITKEGETHYVKSKNSNQPNGCYFM